MLRFLFLQTPPISNPFFRHNGPSTTIGDTSYFDTPSSPKATIIPIEVSTSIEEWYETTFTVSNVKQLLISQRNKAVLARDHSHTTKIHRLRFKMRYNSATTL